MADVERFPQDRRSGESRRSTRVPLKIVLEPEGITVVAVATREERTVLAGAIVKYVAEFPSDKELEERLDRELGCYYMPSGVGISCKVWLEHIAEELR
jgi:hypothetical protein